MINSDFWEEVRNVWIKKETSSVRDLKTGMDGTVDPSLEFSGSVSFFDIDPDEAFKAIQRGEDIPIKKSHSMEETVSSRDSDKEMAKKKAVLDTERFMALIEKKTLNSFSEACSLLTELDIPAKMDDLLSDISEEMLTLQDAITKFDGIYKADMEQFYEYYIPEALELVSTYVEYMEADIDPKIIADTEEEVMSSAGELLIALGDKKNEIYKFGSMELKARSKALETIMNQDGHVNPEYRISN